MQGVPVHESRGRVAHLWEVRQSDPHGFFRLSSTDKSNRPGLRRAQRAAGPSLAAHEVQPRAVFGNGCSVVRFRCGRWEVRDGLPSTTRRVEHLDFIRHTVEVAEEAAHDVDEVLVRGFARLAELVWA